MLVLARGVINFLNQVKREEDAEKRGEQRGPLSTLLKKAKKTSVETVKTRKKFTVPKAKKPKPSEPVQAIKYTKPRKRIDAAKRALDVKTLTDVGSATFDYYYYDAECTD